MSLALAHRKAALLAPWNRDELWRRARAVPSLDLQFADRKSLVDATTGAQLVTFTRASSGTYVDSTGTIRTATTNEARFDHNPVTGESLGLLVEEQRSNLCLHNRTLTDAAWVKTNITAAKDQVGVTGGSNTASKITATAANGTILQTITSASAARATSAYVKRITGTGTVEMTQDNGSTWTAVTVTNNWTRVTIPSATVTNPVVGFRLVTDADAIAVDFVQLETGAFSTSAIETTTAAATRSADVCSISGSNFSSWYRQDEGTVFVGYQFPTGSAVNTSSRKLIDASNGTVDNRFSVRGIGIASTTDQITVRSGASTVAQFSTNGTAVGTTPRTIAAVYRLDDYAAVATGSTSAVTDTSGALPVGVNQVNIGGAVNGAEYLSGHLRRLTYWPQRLGNEALQRITQ